tara:strand:+ start:557 stop:772 length:216 start_codon:yes stop_codon:yes gene_type:complete
MKRYKVTIYETISYEIEFSANSEDDAETLAAIEYKQNGVNNFYDPETIDWNICTVDEIDNVIKFKGVKRDQ